MFDKLFSDEFSYIYPSSVTSDLIREHDEHINNQQQRNQVPHEDDNFISSRELHSAVSRFTKLTTADVIPTRHNPVSRKAPPSLDPYTSTPRSLDLISNNRQSGTPDNTFSPSKSDNNTIDTLKEDKYYEPFDVYHPELEEEKPGNTSLEPFDNYYVPFESPSVGKLQPPQTTSPVQRRPPPLDAAGNSGEDTIAQHDHGHDSEEAEEDEDDEEEEKEEEDDYNETDEEEIRLRKEEKKRRHKEKKKKLAKQAEAAQLAAAQAAGFPFAILPSNVPPPPMPGAPISPTKKKNRDPSSSPKKNKNNQKRRKMVHLHHHLQNRKLQRRNHQRKSREHQLIKASHCQHQEMVNLKEIMLMNKQLIIHQCLEVFQYLIFHRQNQI